MVDIFLHIPKTGGMTLRTALKWIYGPSSCYALPSNRSLHPNSLLDVATQRRIQDADLLYGHSLFGLHRHLDFPYRYFTLLRDPVERVVSHYYYHKRRYPDSSLAALSLKTFLQSDHPVAHSNRQVRVLSGKDPVQSPHASLKSAKDRLTNEVTVFGLTDRFDASLLLFKTCLDWPYPPFYVRRKTNSTRPTVDELPDEGVEAVQNHNRLDIDLYRFAQQHFAQRFDAEVPNPKERLSRFRRLNRVVQNVAPPFLWLYRTGRRLLRKSSASDH